MRAAFSLLEFILAVVLLGILFGVALPKVNFSLHSATRSLLAHIRYTQHLALNDSLRFSTLTQTDFLTTMHPSINAQKLLNDDNFWQIQFHQSGIYTLNSYSIYFDTPRTATTTDRDNQPMSGDIIAIAGQNKKCLSGYSNDNLAIECRNNSEISVRLNEYYGVESITFEGDGFCKETNTFRILFDRFGAPLCSKSALALTQPLKIILTKNNQSQVICVLAQTGFSYISKTKQCF